MVQSSQIWLAGLKPQRSCWYLWYRCESPPAFPFLLINCICTTTPHTAGAGPHGSGPDLLVKGASCGSLLPGPGPRSDPQSAGFIPARRSECSTAEQSMGARTPPANITTIPPEDDGCSVLSLQQGESIRHPYNWLRMRKIKGGKGWKERKREDRLRRCVFGLEWDIGLRVCVLFVLSPRYEKTTKTKWKVSQRQKDMEENWEDRRRGRELAQMKMAPAQQDILSPTLHMSSPILSTTIRATCVENIPHGRRTELRRCSPAKDQHRPKISRQPSDWVWLTLTIGQGFGTWSKGQAFRKDVCNPLCGVHDRPEEMAEGGPWRINPY